MNKQEKHYKVLGLMSGTSLDGLDLCYAEFKHDPLGQWEFQILNAETISYSDRWVQQLQKAHELSAEKLFQLDHEFGNYLGSHSKNFIKKHRIKPDFIASHGHTVFHRPDLAYSVQIGHGANLSAKTGIKSITDFRSADIAKGGQGAPLVPIGDLLLFSEFDACLNLGGIANISFLNESVKSFDICPNNLVLNDLSNRLGIPYDPEGQNAAEGSINAELLIQLNDLDYYQVSGPKSLGREYIEDQITPLMNRFNDTTENFLRTFVEHIAMQVYAVTKLEPDVQRTLVSGGGAKNKFLLERMKALGMNTVVPSNRIIDFKEALIFGFLGVLRMRGETNSLKSVTGANSDSCGGSIFAP